MKLTDEQIADHFQNLSEQKDRIIAELRTQLAEHTQREPFNQRMWDLLRYHRMELHESELITDDEYAKLAEDHPAVARLEDYDKIREQLTKREQEVSKLVALRDKWEHDAIVEEIDFHVTQDRLARGETITTTANVGPFKSPLRKRIAEMNAALAPFLPPAVPEPKGNV